MATCKLPDACTLSVPIETQDTSVAGYNTKICVGGPDPDSNPKRCIAELDLSQLPAATAPADTCGPVSVSGTLRLRLDQLPMRTVVFGSPINYHVTVGGMCGMPAWVDIPVFIQGMGVASANGAIRFGCEPLTLTRVSLNEDALLDATHICNAGALGAVANAIKDLVADQVALRMQEMLRVIDRGRACLDVPAGATPMPAPCVQTPCDLGAACTANGECSAGTCTCGACAL
ncbi:hypothetical protein [Polyangium sorediatum]|uniref:Secreted protein n=1 Tax=Polyangium sorediatum TaxID=889274 RepID=A0ABT6NT38_9BACT|nr:hypothetical protein [Polyangium sorediatum]MDI1431505.1 hypothetical protein [Polyangium sorediatum]